MKVLLVNGSPHQHGCTYTALAETAHTLQEEGIDSEIFWIGNKPIGGCIGCHGCIKLGKCAIDDDPVNAFTAKAKAADAFIFGSPVHYAAATGNLTAFMDRVFYSDGCGKGRAFYLKPAAAVASARRAGTTATLDQLNKYFTIAQMPVISSRYWNMVHGFTPEDVMKDLEGLQVMRVLARNMAYFLKCKAAGAAAGVEPPKTERAILTNFID